MTDMEKRPAAKYAIQWKDQNGESQSFSLTLLMDIFGVQNVAGFITFEEQAVLDHTNYIDGIIPAIHLLIEQKSVDKDLCRSIKQSDGTLLTPFQQAKQYSPRIILFSVALVERNCTRNLRAFQAKLSQLKFLDPAYGSGNFLTEAYLSLRKLENEVLRNLFD